MRSISRYNTRRSNAHTVFSTLADMYIYIYVGKGEFVHTREQTVELFSRSKSNASTAEGGGVCREETLCVTMSAGFNVTGFHALVNTHFD